VIRDKRLYAHSVERSARPEQQNCVKKFGWPLLTPLADTQSCTIS
jgi:hypothetical protein